MRVIWNIFESHYVKLQFYVELYFASYYVGTAVSRYYISFYFLYSFCDFHAWNIIIPFLQGPSSIEKFLLVYW